MNQLTDLPIVFGPAALIHLRCALDLLDRMKALVPAAHAQRAIEALEKELAEAAAAANAGGDLRSVGEIMEAALASLGKKQVDIFSPDPPGDTP